MDELNNFKKLLDDIRDGEPEERNIDTPSPKKSNKGPFINKKSVGKPVLKVNSSKRISDHVKPSDNILWNENRELVLFSLLSSSVLITVGIISSINYLTLAGVLGFLLSSIMIFLLMFTYTKSFKRSFPPDYNTNTKIDELSKKMELMDIESLAGSGFAPSDEKFKEMEGKIEELRTIVRTLIKAVENPR